jgi:hypothetical protein
LDLDPTESNPLPFNDDYDKIVKKIEIEIKIHKEGLIKVPSQLETAPNPFLFPCCKKNNPNISRLHELFKVFTNQCFC